MLFKPIPFWRSFAYYPADYHTRALRKFIVLWIISILPLLVAALFSPANPQTNSISSLIGFSKTLFAEFSGTHQFIYAVSFITPILYLVIEHNEQYVSFLRSKKRKVDDVLKIAPEGFGWILFWAVIVFLFTIVSYAAATTVELRQQKTILDSISEYTVYLVYIFALFCWYYTILESTPAINDDFSTKKKIQEEDLSSRLNDRIEGRL